MAQGYVYDPSQQISQQFQQAGSSIGNIFTTLVAQKQRDYTLAENAFQNVEALKKNLNIFGQKNITEKSNALLKEASNAIFKEGKIDYGKLGEIRQKVSEINDLKQGYDLGAKEFERMVQLGVANKDNLVSFEKFYKDLSTKMADENLVKNPQDLQRQMTEVYTNNLDVNKLFTKSFLAINPLSKKSSTVDVKDSKGNIVKKVNLAYEAPNGISYDANGNKIVSPELADQFIANIKQTSPELLDMMKKQAGVAGDMLSERDLVNAYINRVPTSIVQKEEKSAEELRIQKAQADMAEFKAKTAPEEFNMDMAVKRQNIRQSKAMTELYGAKQAGLSGTSSKTIQPLKSSVSRVQVNVGGKKQLVKREEVPTPNQFVVNIPNIKDADGNELGDVKVISFINQGGQKYATVTKVSSKQSGGWQPTTRRQDNDTKSTYVVKLSQDTENLLMNNVLGEEKGKKTLLSHKLNSMGFNITPEGNVLQEAQQSEENSPLNIGGTKWNFMQ